MGIVLCLTEHELRGEITEPAENPKKSRQKSQKQNLQDYRMSRINSGNPEILMLTN